MCSHIREGTHAHCNRASRALYRMQCIACTAHALGCNTLECYDSTEDMKELNDKSVSQASFCRTSMVITLQLLQGCVLTTDSVQVCICAKIAYAYTPHSIVHLGLRMQ